jgi:sec-independent protein translocase protein TatA
VDQAGQVEQAIRSESQNRTGGKTTAQRVRADTSNLVPAADKGDAIVHFGPPAEIFGVDGIIVLVVVVLVLFGSTQIPKLARSLGSAQKEFKKGLDEGSAEDPKSSEALSQSVPPAAMNPPSPAASPVEANGDGSAGSTS